MKKESAFSGYMRIYSMIFVLVFLSILFVGIYAKQRVVEDSADKVIADLNGAFFLSEENVVPLNDFSGNLSFEEFFDEINNTLTRIFYWRFRGYLWSLDIKFNSDAYLDYSKRSRNLLHSDLVDDSRDDELIKDISYSLTRGIESQGLSKSFTPYLAISFVQAIPYSSDNVSTGYDEYPRYPFETLYYNGGDCEDMSILAAAILKEMGYGVVLILFEGEHMGVGIKCDDTTYGYRYNYYGQDFCYLETTGKGWDIGKVPDEFVKKKAIIIPV